MYGVYRYYPPNYRGRRPLAPRAVGSGSASSISPGAGSLTYTGFAPELLYASKITPGADSLVYTGYAPTLISGLAIQPAPGRLIYTGFAPTILGLTPGLRLIPVVNNLEQLRKAANAILGDWQVRSLAQASVAFSGQSVSNGGVIPYSNKEFDLQSEYDTVTQAFTATRPGRYRVHAMLFVSALAAGKYVAIDVDVNGVRSALSEQDFNDSGGPRQSSAQVSRIFSLAAGDVVKITLVSDHVGALSIVGAPYSYFEIDQVNL